MYTPLYVKSNYSFLTSLVKIDELIKKCKKENISSVALTDNNMIATLYFYKECQKNDINPIIGLEIELEEKLLLYAKDYKGYQNLLKIVSSIDELKYDLLKQYKDNIICIIPYIYKESFNKISKIYSDIYLGVTN